MLDWAAADTPNRRCLGRLWQSIESAALTSARRIRHVQCGRRRAHGGVPERLPGPEVAGWHRRYAASDSPRESLRDTRAVRTEINSMRSSRVRPRPVATASVITAYCNSWRNCASLGVAAPVPRSAK